MLYIPKIDREEGILDGVIDIHCHAGPCIFAKDLDEIELEFGPASEQYFHKYSDFCANIRDRSIDLPE